MVVVSQHGYKTCLVDGSYPFGESESYHSNRGDLGKKLIESKPTSLPILQLFVLLYMQMAEPITAHTMLPFIVQLIKETGITSGDVAKVGYYSGLVESLFFAAEALTILQWGRLSDRVGRRPVLLTGLFGLSLSMLCFGLSHTFWAVAISRAIAGALNGNTGVIKCVVGEVTDETNMAQGFATLPLAWSIGNTLGPLIGGMLQHPYERLGGIFRRSDFWRLNPYFLPCVVAALYSTSAFILGFLLLKETAPRANVNTSLKYIQAAQYTRLENNVSVTDTPITSTDRSCLIQTREPAPPSLRTLLTPRVLVAILNYSLLAIVDISFLVLQPLFLSSPISHGGLGMPPSLIGACLAVFGILNGTVTAVFFSPLIRRFGTKRVATCCVATYLGCFPLFPLMNALARVDEGVTPFVWLIFTTQLALASLTPMGFSSIFLYLTSAAPTRSALGATNGLAQTITSIMRTIGPAGATSLFALSIERNLLGGGFVYVVLCVLAACSTAATLLLPAKPWAWASD